ncbi:hypothetical protein OF83DRAFT_514084 [Amylostereum chailletii]|nr:hypothetical protein OF83DRAFT_514084 [Amylostereum chailletii]
MTRNVSVETTLEPLLICGIVSMILYGVFVAQVYHYFVAYPDDRPPTKVTVLFVLLMETLQQALLVHTLWFYLVATDASEISSSTDANWSFLGRLIPTELATVTVECFFVGRLWLLSDRRKIYLLLLLPVAIGFGLGIANVVHLFRYPAFGEAKTSTVYIIAWTAARTFADISIALATCCKVYRSRRGVSVQFRSVLTSVFSFTLTTGLLTSLFALLVLVTYLVSPYALVYAGIYTIYGKIFANSMLASLNNRRSLRARAHHDVDLDSFNVANISTSGDTGTGSESEMGFVPHLRRVEESQGSSSSSDPESQLQKFHQTPVDCAQFPAAALSTTDHSYAGAGGSPGERRFLPSWTSVHAPR